MLAKFHLTEAEQPIIDQLSAAAKEIGVDAYLVGGFVRDRLLGRESKDIDVVCVGSGIELATAFAKRLRPKPNVQYFKNFGTAMLLYKDIEIEFVGARKESYQRDSRKPIVEDGTLEDDQNRRDFTINALAVKLDSLEVIDPFGGIEDLQNGILRTPLDPAITFSDDPLRMLRAIRFATQLNFKIEPNTFRALKEQSERLKIISMERISGELNKIIAAPKPSIGFKLLLDTGLLAIFFPEMVALFGVETRNGKAHKDNFYHTLKVVDNTAEMTDNLWLRWSAVLHDIAKPAVKKFSEEEDNWTFHGHEAVGARWVPRIFARLKLPLDGTMKYVQKNVELHMRPITLTKSNISDSAVRRLLFEASDDIEDLMLLCKADITSANDAKVRRYLENYDFLQARLREIEEKDKLRNWQPPISGEVIMETFGIKPSKEVGSIKNAIREAILDGIIPNEYEPAYTLMLAQGEKLGLVKVD